MKPTLTVSLTRHGTPDVVKRVQKLVKRQVLVGVPRTKTARREPQANNAMLAYIHDKGSPLQGIPQREFMRTGIQEGKADILRRLEQAGKLALNGVDPEPALIATGLEAQKAVRNKLTRGPFTPLKPATLRARRRRGRTGTRPLIDTGQLRQAINFVLRDKA